MRRVVLIAAGGIAIALGLFWFSNAGSVVDSVDVAIEDANALSELNEALADSAPQQQVVALWHANELQQIAIRQSAAQTADVVTALSVVMGILGLLTLSLGLALPTNASVDVPTTPSTTGAHEAPPSGESVTGDEDA